MTTLEKYPTQYVKNWYCKDCHKTIDPLSEENSPEHLFCNIIEDNRNSTEVLRDVVEPIEFYEPEPTENKSDQEKIEACVGWIKNVHRVKTIKETGKMMSYDNGRYTPFLKSEAKNMTEEWFDHCTIHIKNEVVSKLEDCQVLYSIKDFNTDFSKLSLNQGILDLQTGILTEHHDKFLTTVKIPRNYDPKAKCPMFIKYLVDALGSKEDIITVVEAMANILLVDKDNKEIVTVQVGNGGSGKSTLLKIIRGVIGAENCSSVPLHSMKSGGYDLYEIEGKLANIGTDISNKELDDLSEFKKIVSGDPTPVRTLYERPHDMVAFAKHFFSANEMPNILDSSDSLFRRFYCIEFNNNFSGSNDRILDYDKVILEKEADGIFNLMYQNYKTLQRNKKFRYPQSLADVRDKMKVKADKLLEFVQTILVKQPNFRILKADLDQKYTEWCNYKHYDALNIRKLGNRLPNYGLKAERTRESRYWTGYNWNYENQWVKDNIKKPELLGVTL